MKSVVAIIGNFSSLYLNAIVPRIMNKGNIVAMYLPKVVWSVQLGNAPEWFPLSNNRKKKEAKVIWMNIFSFSLSDLYFFIIIIDSMKKIIPKDNIV